MAAGRKNTACESCGAARRPLFLIAKSLREQAAEEHSAILRREAGEYAGAAVVALAPRLLLSYALELEGRCCSDCGYAEAERLLGEDRAAFIANRARSATSPTEGQS